MTKHRSVVPSPSHTEPDELVPVARARIKLGKNGKAIARQTVFSLATRGEIEARLVAGRFVVTSASIDAYHARHRESSAQTTADAGSGAAR